MVKITARKPPIDRVERADEVALARVEAHKPVSHPEKPAAITVTAADPLEAALWSEIGRHRYGPGTFRQELEAITALYRAARAVTCERELRRAHWVLKGELQKFEALDAFLSGVVKG
ncbi:hypothetical protein [Jannaschia sp. LMIT008]|uniref:hypothetical protein n=1 Tax=Jannaschia maritima TaxID=3032585 RepID=UPI002811BD76|nr:hypothetical protein [Jannaschia sp. LMIT008]